MKNKRRAVLLRVGGKNIAILGGASLAAGLCNGLLGAGGGVILIIVLSMLFGREDTGRIYANALAVMFCLSALTLWRYLSFGTGLKLGDSGGVWLLAGAAIGGLVGGVALGKLKAGFMGRLFAGLTVLSGLLMIFA